MFEKGGVYLHTSARKHQDPDSLIAGVIRVVEKVGREGAGFGQAQSEMKAASVGVWSGGQRWAFRKTEEWQLVGWIGGLCEAEGPGWGRSSDA